jgi:hypothetical protein
MHTVHYDESTKMVSQNFTLKIHTDSKSSLLTQNGLQLEILGSKTKYHIPSSFFIVDYSMYKMR